MKFLYFAEVGVPVVTAIFGLVILVLGADLMSYTTAFFDNRMFPRHNHNAKFTYAVNAGMDYSPRHMPYTRPSLIVAVGVLCTVMNAVIGFSLAKDGRPNSERSGKKFSGVSRKAFVLAADAILLILVLVTTIYSWLPTFEPLVSHKVTKVMYTGDHWVWDNEHTTFDPANWFCALYPYIPYHQNLDVANRCRQGNALIDLLIPVLLLQTLATALHLWSAITAKKAQKNVNEKLGNESD